jgi:hypothetical protein
VTNALDRSDSTTMPMKAACRMSMSPLSTRVYVARCGREYLQVRDEAAQAEPEGFGGFRPRGILNRSFAVVSSERMSPSSIAERLLVAASDRSCRPIAEVHRP